MVREHTLCNLNSSNSFIILILLNWLRFGSFKKKKKDLVHFMTYLGECFMCAKRMCIGREFYKCQLNLVA